VNPRNSASCIWRKVSLVSPSIVSVRYTYAPTEVDPKFACAISSACGCSWTRIRMRHANERQSALDVGEDAMFLKHYDRIQYEPGKTRRWEENRCCTCLRSHLRCEALPRLHLFNAVVYLVILRRYRDVKASSHLIGKSVPARPS